MTGAGAERAHRCADTPEDDASWRALETQYREECATMLRDAQRHLEQRVASERTKIENALALFSRDFEAWLEREKRGESSPKPSLATLFEIWLERGARNNEPRPLLASLDQSAKRRLAMAEAEAAALRERLDHETERSRDLERRLQEARAQAQRQPLALMPALMEEPLFSRTARRGVLVAAVIVALAAVAAIAALTRGDAWLLDLARARDSIATQGRRALADLAAGRAGAEALTALLAADKTGTIGRVITFDPDAARERLDAIAPARATIGRTPDAAIAPAPTAPEPKPAAFRDIDNRDLAGAPLATLRGLDLAGCAVACGRRADCRAYVFDKWNRVCRLKASAAAFLINPRATAGLREDVPAPHAPSGPVSMERYPSKAFPGAGYRTLASEGPRACESACRSEESCVAFTFRLDEGACHLFATTDEYFSNPLADSGGKRQE